MIGAGDAVSITTTAGVFQLTRGGPRRLLSHGLAGACADRGGGFWGVRDFEILHVRGGKRRSFALPPGIGLMGHCVKDNSGRLWVTLYQGGVMWRDAGGWHRPAKPLPDVEWARSRTESGRCPRQCVLGRTGACEFPRGILDPARALLYRGDHEDIRWLARHLCQRQQRSAADSGKSCRTDRRSALSLGGSIARSGTDAQRRNLAAAGAVDFARLNR